MPLPSEAVFTPPRSAPRLRPRQNQLVVAGNSATAMNDADAMKALATNVAATGTLTIAGTFSTSSLLSAVIRGVTVSYQVVGGDTNNNGAAASFAAAINANVALAPYIRATVATNVITITAVVPGNGGNTFGFTTAVVGGTMTSTAAPTTGFMSGGSGAITPLETRGIQLDRNYIDLYSGEPIPNPSAALVAALRDGGILCN